jgi:mono/diheme cytochrome c family protein
MGSSMMARHHAAIPDEYAGLTNPILADEASIERGANIYTAQCASCHGDGGMGDGPAAVSPPCYPPTAPPGLSRLMR